MLLWTLGLSLFFYNWPLQAVFPLLAKLKPTILLPALAGLVWLTDPLPIRAHRRVDGRIYRFLAAILCLGFLSIPFSANRRVSFDFFTTDLIFSFAWMTFLAAAIRTERDVEWLMRAFAIGCFAYTGFSFARSGGGRLAGIAYYDANDLGLMVLCALPFSVHLVRKRGGIWKLFGVVSAAFGVYIVIQTESRGAFLGLVAVGAYILTAYRSVSKAVRIGVVGLAVVVLFVFAGGDYWTRMSTVLKPTEDYNFSGQTAAGRGEIWKRGIGYMLKNPVGVGLNAFGQADGRSELAIAMVNSGHGFKWTAPHNSFVQVGAELGVGGAFCFISAIVLIFKALLRVSKNADPSSERGPIAEALTACMVAYVVSGFFLSFAYSTLIYFLFGVILGFLKLEPLIRGAKGTASPARAPVRGRRKRPFRPAQAAR
ncbi:MAG: O-antigen ligase family protein [Gemmatimonadota bacterium]